MSQQIIGLSGTFASGKDTLADWIEHHGFVHVSTSDMVRKGCEQKYGSTDRKHLRIYANEVRTQHGGDIFVKQALEETKGNHKIVISGIRAIAEVELLKSKGASLVFVDAPIKLRYERAHKRDRDEEVESFEKFKTSEEKELNKPKDNKIEQNIGAVKDMADQIIINDADLGTLFAEATALLQL